jgi:lambda family phage holin
MFDSLTNRVPPEWIAIMLAVILAVARVLRDDKEATWQRAALEGATCGLMTLAGGSAIYALGLSVYWVLLIGGVIGGIGSLAARSILLSILRTKAGI